MTKAVTNYKAYTNRIGVHSLNKRERLTEEKKAYLTRTQHEYLRDVTINGIAKSLVIISTDNPYVKRIHSSQDDSYRVGDFVCFKNQHWIISEADVDDEIDVSGEMTMCIGALKFQDTSGSILSYPYSVDTSLPSITYLQQVTTSDTIRKIITRLDDDTCRFRLGKRFMGDIFADDPQCWKINDLDAGNKPGLLVITLEKDEYVPNLDNIELGVCNYTFPLPSESTGQCKITYSGRPQIRIGGAAKKFTAEFKDEDGNVLDDVEVVWSVSLPAGHESSFMVVQNGSFITVRAADDMVIEGSIITITLSDEDETCSASVQVEVIRTI